MTRAAAGRGPGGAGGVGLAMLGGGGGGTVGLFGEEAFAPFISIRQAADKPDQSPNPEAKARGQSPSPKPKALGLAQPQPVHNAGQPAETAPPTGRRRSPPVAL